MEYFSSTFQVITAFLATLSQTAPAALSSNTRQIVPSLATMLQIVIRESECMEETI